MDSDTWTVTIWLVHFAERTGGKLVTFPVVNLIASINYALITVAPFFFPCCVVVCYHGIQTLCLPLCTGTVRKKALTLAHWVASLLQLCESLRGPTKISDMSEIRLTFQWLLGSRQWPSLPPIRCVANNVMHRGEQTKLKLGSTLKWVTWLNNWVTNRLKRHSVCPALALQLTDCLNEWEMFLYITLLQRFWTTVWWRFSCRGWGRARRECWWGVIPIQQQNQNQENWVNADGLDNLNEHHDRGQETEDNWQWKLRRENRCMARWSTARQEEMNQGKNWRPLEMGEKTHKIAKDGGNQV